jgi:hypothetical protein
MNSLMRWLRKHSWGVFLFCIALVFMVAQWLTHDGSLKEYVNAATENLQSEAWQLWAAIVGPVVFYHIGYRHFEKDTEQRLERMERQLDDIEEHWRVMRRFLNA